MIFRRAGRTFPGLTETACFVGFLLLSHGTLAAPGNCADKGNCGDHPDGGGSQPAAYFEISSDTRFTKKVRPESFHAPNNIGTGLDAPLFNTPQGGPPISSMKGSGAISNASFADVPVPATLSLIGLGLAGLVWSRRRKR